MKAMGTLGIVVGIVAMARPALGSTHQVDCDDAWPDHYESPADGATR